MDESLTCPVCRNKMSKAICKKCGYTRFLFPKELPPQMEKFEQIRIRIMKDHHKKMVSAPQIKDSIGVIKREIVGTLIIRNLLTESIHAYPINAGRNIYGSLQSNNSSRVFIDPIIIGIDLPEIIFEIEASENCMKLIPHSEYTLSHNHYLIKGIMKVDNDDHFFHSNVLSFNAVIF